jgi:hypothetical protein
LLVAMLRVEWEWEWEWEGGGGSLCCDWTA